MSTSKRTKCQHISQTEQIKYKLFEKLVINLNNLSIAEIKRLNTISDEIKIEYHTLLENIYSRTERSITWETSSVLSRNNYLSKIFTDLCYLEYIKRRINEKGIREIVVKNSVQKQVLGNYINGLKINVKINNSEKTKEKLKYHLSPLYHFLVNLITIFKRLLIKNKKRIQSINQHEKIILIDTYFLPSMFKGRQFKDRYYPGLLKNISNKKKNIYFVPTVLIEKKLKKAIKISDNAPEQFLYKFDYLGIRDYFFALFSPFRLKSHLLDNLKFHGLDISKIFKSELYMNRFNVNSFKGLLNYKFFKALKKKGVKLELVVNWFENQPHDRGFNKGKNQYYPNVKSIGYQGFMVPYEYNFHIQPTEAEYRMGLTPDWIAPIGSALLPEVSKYCKNLPTMVAPAFRFKGVYNEPRNHSNGNYENNTILVALPISVPESFDILSLVIESMSDKSLSKINWLVKPHPSLDLGKIEAKFPLLFKNFLLLEGSFDKAIARAKLMVGNASSTSMEALAHGIPVIIVGSRNGFFQNPIPHSVPKDIWSFCITKDEFIGSVNRLLYNTNSSQIPNFKGIGEEIREDYFEPVNQKTVNAFFNINQTN